MPSDGIPTLILTVFDGGGDHSWKTCKCWLAPDAWNQWHIFNDMEQVRLLQPHHFTWFIRPKPCRCNFPQLKSWIRLDIQHMFTILIRSYRLTLVACVETVLGVMVDHEWKHTYIKDLQASALKILVYDQWGRSGHRKSRELKRKGNKDVLVRTSFQVQLIKCVIEKRVWAICIHGEHVFLCLSNDGLTACRNPARPWTLLPVSRRPPTVNHRAVGIVKAWVGISR